MSLLQCPSPFVPLHLRKSSFSSCRAGKGPEKGQVRGPPAGRCHRSLTTDKDLLCKLQSRHHDPLLGWMARRGHTFIFKGAAVDHTKKTTGHEAG